MEYSFSTDEVKVLNQVLALTSVDNDIVRELRVLFSGPPEMEQVSQAVYNEEGDQQERHGLKCPWCGYTAWDDPEHLGDAHVVVFDVAWRESEFFYHHDDSEVRGSYNDDYSFEGGGYACPSCYKRVSLPPHITEEGDY